MPAGTPYHSFALPYPIRVDNFTDTIDDLPPPYNRPRLHLLTHTHTDHVAGLASKSFAQRVICSPDAKEMLLRHEVYAERSLYDNEYRAEKKKTFGHLKVDPLVRPNGQKLYAGSRDLLHAIPLNTPTEFDISDTETVTITLIDANHCPGSVMFLIEGSRGTVLHTGDLRAEPWFLSSIQRNHFLQPYLASSSEDLRIFVARNEGTHPEATGLVKTLEAIYLDTACLLSSVAVPAKERAAQDIVGLMALFPSTTHFFINCWTWGYEDVLKTIARAFHCKIHFDRYKHSIYSHGSDPFLRALGTRDASSTRFHACERFDRCSFVDVPLHDYADKGVAAPLSKEGKKVVYVNPVTMSCSHWEDYQANVRRRVLRGDNVDSLLVPLSRHSPLPELMNFVTLFRPLRVIPNTLDPSLDGLDWGAMSKMFSGCLSPASTSGSLASVMAPPCPLTCHPSVTGLPAPSTKYDSRTLSAVNEGHIDAAYSNLIGPSDAADQWGEKGGKKSRIEVLRAWIGTGRRKSFGNTRRHVDEDEVAVLNEHGSAAGPSRFTSSGIAPRTPKRYARGDDSSGSSDEGGSDDHARTAWKLFGVGEIADACKTWVSPSPQSQSGIRVDIGALPTPTSSPLLHGKRLDGSYKGKECVMEHASQSNVPLATPLNTPLTRTPTEIILPPVSSPLTSFVSVSVCTSPFVSFGDIQFFDQSPEERTNEVVESTSQPLARLDNVIVSDASQGPLTSPRRTQHRNQSQKTQTLHQGNPSITQDITSVGMKRDTENVDQASPVKRRRVDRQESELKVGELDRIPELAGRKLVQSKSLDVVDGARVLPPVSSGGLIRTPTIPSVMGIDDKRGSLSATTSAVEVEDILAAAPRSSPAPAVTATYTISFPVRKRIENRGKTASQGSMSSPRTGTGKELGPTLAACSTSAIAQPPVLAVERASRVVRAKTLSTTIGVAASDAGTRGDGVPVSPRTAARRAERAERRRITERLRLARPDLARARSSKGARALDRGVVGSASATPFVSGSTSASACAAVDGERREASASTRDDRTVVTEEDVKMDWERSRRLAERVREALERGGRASEVLPRLRCLERT